MIRTHLATLALVSAATAAWAEPASFDSPEAALDAVIAGLEAEDRDALVAVFGPENVDLLTTDNPADDRRMWLEFLESYNIAHVIEMPDPDRAIIIVGRNLWPFPVPLVAVDGVWQFDPEAGREEILMRRIGLNELDVIDIMRQAPSVQIAYRQVDYDGDGVMEFAASILSSDGKRDGLYWPPEEGAPESPIGAFMATASAGGYNFDGTDSPPDPYAGYYFHILQKQGPDAPGGALDYLVNGNMVSGHALLAYPAAYGDTGIMTFMVNEAGTVYEADLGADTLAVAEKIDAFNPGEGWSVTQE